MTLQSGTFSCGSSHSQANTAEASNHLHSLTLTAVQICQIFKYFKGGFSLSSHNNDQNRSCTNYFKRICSQVHSKAEITKLCLGCYQSETYSTAAAQNKLSSFKQDGRSMHEYITHFSDLLEHAYSVKATDVGTNLIANQFIEGIDDTNKYMKNKLKIWH